MSEPKPPRPPAGKRKRGENEPTCSVNARMAGDNHQVVTVIGDYDVRYRTQPCAQCPWRKDQVGAFPAEAFRISANTAYDMSTHQFACHMAGVEKNPVTCAGFLLRGSAHNLAIRMALARGDMNPEVVSDGGHELHESYRDMAVANGVSKRDPIIAPCRS